MWSKTERWKWAKRERTTSMSLFQEPGEAGEQLLKRPGAAQTRLRATERGLSMCVTSEKMATVFPYFIISN